MSRSSSGNSSFDSNRAGPPARNPLLLLAVVGPLTPELKSASRPRNRSIVAPMVMTRYGAPSLFVSRILADVAFESVERNAERSGGRGTSRLIALDGAADWMW